MLNRYKDEYLQSGQKNDYDECRFAKDKLAYAKQWIKDNDVEGNSFNFENPQNIVDRLIVEKFETIKHPNSYASLLKRRWCDKIAVNDCLKEMGFSDLIIPYVWCEYTKELKLSVLEMLDQMNDGPYIIKTNHGSGWNIRYIPGVSNKKNVLECVNGWLNTNYAYISGMEEQYRWVKPGIIIQKLLAPNTLMDWSFWCEEGKISAIGLTKKSGKNFEEYIAFVDENGKQNDWYIGCENELDNLNKKQLETVNRMKPYVLKIAEKFKLVRVDMYCVNEKIYFGETTFTPCSGILTITNINK